MRQAGTDRPQRRLWLVPLALALTIAGRSTGAGAVIGPLLIGAAVVLPVVIVRLVRGARRRRVRARVLGGETSAVLLGDDSRGRPVLVSDRQLSAHGLILGASGAGKSTTMLTLLTEHVRRGRPVVAIDMKGSADFARRLEAAAVAAGRSFRIWTPDGPSHWNPLQHGNATELKDKLIATERFTEPHYQRAAERYVQAALQVLQEVHPERPATIEEVVDALDPRRLSLMARRLPRARAERLQDYLAALTPDQISAVRGLAARLAIVTESHTGPFLRPALEPAVDLRAALSGREVTVFSLNSSRYGKLAAQLGTLAIQDLITAVGDRLDRVERPLPGEPAPAQVLVGIDEFSALGSDNVVALLARGRAAGVSVLLATQELADLDRAARGVRDQIVGNAAIKIAHRQDVPSSAHAIAQMVGTDTVWERSYNLSPGLLGDFRTGRGVQRAVEKFVIHPNEITSLGTGEAVVITKLPRAAAETVRVRPPRVERGGPELG